MVGDRLWLARFKQAPIAPHNLKAIDLDAILYDEFAALWRARRQQDQQIIEYFDGLAPAILGGTLTYTNSAGVEYTDPLAVLAAHLFNHQTHHRGQAHHMLGEAGLNPPSFDMHRLINP